MKPRQADLTHDAVAIMTASVDSGESASFGPDERATLQRVAGDLNSLTSG
jgi:hypothetical protein